MHRTRSSDLGPKNVIHSTRSSQNRTESQMHLILIDFGGAKAAINGEGGRSEEGLLNMGRVDTYFLLKAYFGRELIDRCVFELLDERRLSERWLRYLRVMSIKASYQERAGLD